VLPTLEVPVLSTISPLTPEIPAFAVCIRIAPLDVSVPYPLKRIVRPPLNDDDIPPERVTSPPAPQLPEPEEIKIDPARPLVAVPVPKYILPLSPRLEVPVLRINMPLTPALPAFVVCRRIAPLEEPSPKPLYRMVRPPLAAEEIPAERTTSPPTPQLPEPEVMKIDPARPDVAMPLPT
jgi:hypothetical protein